MKKAEAPNAVLNHSVSRIIADALPEPATSADWTTEAQANRLPPAKDITRARAHSG